MIFASCSNPGNKKPVVENSRDTIKKELQGDSIFIAGDFLLEGPKDMKFEVLKHGDHSTVKTKGDTLYADKEVLILGDFSALIGMGVYKKFGLKSEFNYFHVPVYKGKLSEPNFSSDPDANYFITRIKEGCKDSSVNFAGHYTIVEWGCGAACQQMAVVDRMNGSIIFSAIPFDTADGHCGIDYKIDSRMLIVNTEALSGHKGYKLEYWRTPAVYELKDGRFEKLE